MSFPTISHVYFPFISLLPKFVFTLTLYDNLQNQQIEIIIFNLQGLNELI